MPEDLPPHDLIAAALAEDADMAARLFQSRPDLRGDLMSALLAQPGDGPSAVFARLWRQIDSWMDEPQTGFLRWYLRAEANSPHPLRAAVHRDTLTRILLLHRLPDTETGWDLAFTAVRVACEASPTLALQSIADRFLQRQAGLWFDRPVAEGAVPLPPLSMVYAAVGAMHLSLLRRMVQLILDHAPAPRRPEWTEALDWALSVLMSAQGGLDPWIIQVIDAEARRDPAAPAVVHRGLTLDLARGIPLTALTDRIQGMRLDRADPQLKAALQLIHARARLADLPTLGDWAVAQLVALDPDWREGEAPGPIAPLPEALDQSGPMLEPIAGADLDALVAHARALTQVPLTLDSPPGPQRLTQAFALLCERIARAPVPQGWTLVSFTQAAESLRQLTLREFAWITHFTQTPHAGGRAEYGTLDLNLFAVLHDGLMQSAAAISLAGLAWTERGHPIGGAWALAALVQVHARAWIGAGRPAMALPLLDRLSGHGVMDDILAVERDTLRLAGGDLDKARTWPPLARLGSTVHAYLPRADWSAAESLSWQVLDQDPVLTGQFLLDWPDGRVQLCDHATPSRALSLARVPGLSTLAEGLLIGPGDHVLRPDYYHTSRDYPQESLTVIAPGPAGLRMRPQRHLRRAEPVLLLEAMAALHWPNYYHWMIPHLSRIAYAMDRGLLDGRQLVLPQGLRSWMLDTLDLIGLTPDQRLVVDVNDRITFDDAAILSSIEHLSPATLAALRRRMLGPEALAAPPPDGPVLFLSRRNRSLRKLANEDQIEAMAVDLGFTLVVPEEMTVAQQRDLFSRARGIAAPEGAALTNMIFAPPGARVLSVLCENDMMPVFTDLALVLGQHHRKLAGRGMPSPLGGMRFQPEYLVDLELARRALAWVIGDAAPRSVSASVVPPARKSASSRRKGARR